MKSLDGNKFDEHWQLYTIHRREHSAWFFPIWMQSFHRMSSKMPIQEVGLCWGELHPTSSVLVASKRIGRYVQSILFSTMWLLRDSSETFSGVICNRQNTKTPAISDIWDLSLNNYTRSTVESIPSACLHFQNTLRSVLSWKTFQQRVQLWAIFQSSADVDTFLPWMGVCLSSMGWLYKLAARNVL